MCYSRLQLFPSRDPRRLSVRNDIDDSDPIQANHLLEVHEPSIIPVHIVRRDSEVRAVPVRLHDDTPVRRRELGRRQVHEDGLRARLQNRVCLMRINQHLGRKADKK